MGLQAFVSVAEETDSAKPLTRMIPQRSKLQSDRQL
jgi:hypothetical protein